MNNQRQILRRYVASLISAFFLLFPIGLLAERPPEPTFLAADLRCLASAVYHEAKGEPEQGQLAVAHVVINRMTSGLFSDSLCGVVYQKTYKVCQFSWVCVPGKSKEEPSIEAKEIAWKVAYQITKDPSKGALYFHAKHIGKTFDRKRTTVIGNHIFYK